MSRNGVKQVLLTRHDLIYPVGHDEKGEPVIDLGRFEAHGRIQVLYKRGIGSRRARISHLARIPASRFSMPCSTCRYDTPGQARYVTTNHSCGRGPPEAYCRSPTALRPRGFYPPNDADLTVDPNICVGHQDLRETIDAIPTRRRFVFRGQRSPPLHPQGKPSILRLRATIDGSNVAPRNNGQCMVRNSATVRHTFLPIRGSNAWVRNPGEEAWQVAIYS